MGVDGIGPIHRDVTAREQMLELQPAHASNVRGSRDRQLPTVIQDGGDLRRHLLLRQVRREEQLV